MAKVSISIEPAKNNFVEYAKSIEGIADLIHIDYMNGTYVPSHCFSSKDVEKLNNITTAVLDCHLMASNPLNLIPEFLKSGANIITVQLESASESEIFKCLEHIKLNKAIAGISIDLNTSINQIEPFLNKCNLVLVMCVKAGASSQKFDEACLKKIEFLKNYREQNNLNYIIEVDGGINDITSKKAVLAGADILVSGSYVFNSNKKDEAIKNLKYISV